MHIGKAIKYMREKKGMTQTEFAKICNLSQTALSQIERGNKVPHAKTVTRIAVALDMPDTMLYILGMEEDDVTNEKKKHYAALFPAIRAMILEIFSSSALSAT